MSPNDETPMSPQEETRQESGAVERWLTEARALIDRGCHQEALALLDRAFAAAITAGGASEAVGFRALALSGLGRLPEAIAAAQTAATAAPQSMMAQARLALVLREGGRYEEALVALEAALQLRPDIWLLWSLKADTLDHLGRYREALGAIDQAITLNPGDAECWTWKGHILLRLGRNEEALAACDEALRLEPNRYVVQLWLLRNKARALAHLRRFQEAWELADHVTHLDPSAMGAWELVAASLQELGRYEEAVAAWKRYLALQPEEALGWYNLRGALYNLDQLEESLAAADRSLAINPRDERVRFWRNLVLARLSLEERLPSSVDLATETELQGMEPWLGAAVELRKLKRFDEALAGCDEAIARAPGDPRPIEVKFRILRNRLRWREALPVFRELVRLQIEQRRQRQEQQQAMDGSGQE